MKQSVRQLSGNNEYSIQWNTPRWFFEQLDRRFHFTLDPCCTKENALCEKYYTTETNGLAQDWGGEIVYMNPPYGREITQWVRKAAEESKKPGTTIVALIPARTDTKWFHDYVMPYAEIEFVRGRLRFSGATNNAPFASMIAIYGGEK